MTATVQHATLRIDAHHHLWHYTAEDFGWLSGELAVLQKDFCANDLQASMATANVAAAVAVQARQSTAETDFLLQQAALHPAVAGVVGWLPAASDEFPAVLERYAGNNRLKGIRHVVQAEPAGFLEGADFNRGIRHLQGTGLAYDVLIQEQQLPEAIDFVDRHPLQMFVVDHVAKPRIADGALEPWARNLRDLARRPNVSCKLSGMVTEASAAWTPALLEPYFEVALEAFTPKRLMVGSDWPVLTPRCSYEQWWQAVEQWLQPLSADERGEILGGTAMRTYHLRISDPKQSKI